MKKKVKFLYIDAHSITRDFFELCLKASSIDLVTLEDFSTFTYNLEEFDPDLILVDTKTMLDSTSADDYKLFMEVLKKQPENFVLCGKIEDIEQLAIDGTKRFLKPYVPHDLELQLMTYLPKEAHKKDQAH